MNFVPFLYFAQVLFFQVALTDVNIWSILDKYGFPTALLAIVLPFLWNRQKRADSDRNDLISRNNELTQQLLTAVKVGNACKFIEKGENKNDG